MSNPVRTERDRIVDRLVTELVSDSDVVDYCHQGALSGLELSEIEWRQVVILDSLGAFDWDLSFDDNECGMAMRHYSHYWDLYTMRLMDIVIQILNKMHEEHPKDLKRK